MLTRRTWCLPLLMLAVAALTASPLRADDKDSATLAHVKLAGGLEEAPPSADPLLGTMGENFKSKLDRIKKARKDKDVQGLYLQIDGVGLGWAKLDELTRALADFRAAGKKVYAYVEAGSSRDYLLALACDEICVPESGWLLLTGVRAEITFYKDLFDKIGVKADMLQMGDYKGAGETFTRNSMSKANREQWESVLDDYYEKGLVERVVKGRPGQKFSAEQVKKLIDQGPYTARGAAKAGLIDHVAYAEAFQEKIKGSLKVSHLKLIKNYAQEKAEDLDVFSLYKKLLFGPKPLSTSRNPKVAVIYATGTIVTGKSGPSLLGGESCGSTTIIEAIRQAEADKTVKAIVLRVDSPGGSALASDLIWNELNKCKKPVVASMSDVAASGGYYVSMAARKIYAEPGTLTGSIGVVGGKLALGGLYAKVGIKTEVISRGANAGILSTTEPFTKSEKEAMTALMKDVYDQFLNKAVAGRKKAGKTMERAELEKLAGGRIWTGRQALANGLIDELGTLDEAVADAWKMAGMGADKEPELLVLPKSRSFLDILLDSKADSRLGALALPQLPLLRDLPEVTRKLAAVEAMLRLRGEPGWLVLPYLVEVR
jgi:protease-4